jgi:hypothetical protein
MVAKTPVKKIWATGEVAKALRVGRKTIHDMARALDLPVIQIGQARAFETESVQLLAERLGKKWPAK